MWCLEAERLGVSMLTYICNLAGVFAVILTRRPLTDGWVLLENHKLELYRTCEILRDLRRCSNNFKNITFSNSSCKVAAWVFVVKWCHVYRKSLMRSQRWFSLWLGTVWQQTINWTNVDPDLYRYFVSLGHNKLNRFMGYPIVFMTIIIEELSLLLV